MAPKKQKKNKKADDDDYWYVQRFALGESLVLSLAMPLFRSSPSELAVLFAGTLSERQSLPPVRSPPRSLPRSPLLPLPTTTMSLPPEEEEDSWFVLQLTPDRPFVCSS